MQQQQQRQPSYLQSIIDRISHHYDGADPVPLPKSLPPPMPPLVSSYSEPLTHAPRGNYQSDQVHYLTTCLERLLSEVGTIASEVAMQKGSIQNLDEGLTSHRDEIENINSAVSRLCAEDRFQSGPDGPKQNVFWRMIENLQQENIALRQRLEIAVAPVSSIQNQVLKLRAEFQTLKHDSQSGVFKFSGSEFKTPDTTSATSLEVKFDAKLQAMQQQLQVQFDMYQKKISAQLQAETRTSGPHENQQSSGRALAVDGQLSALSAQVQRLQNQISNASHAPTERRDAAQSHLPTQQSVLALVTSRVATEVEARERSQRDVENTLETVRQEAAEATRRVGNELHEHRNASARVPMDIVALRRDVDSLQTMVQRIKKRQAKQQSNVLEPPSPTPPSPLDDSAMVTRVRNLEDRCIGCVSACDQATRDCTALRQRLDDGLESVVGRADRAKAILQPQIDRLRQSVLDLESQVQVQRSLAGQQSDHEKRLQQRVEGLRDDVLALKRSSSSSRGDDDRATAAMSDLRARVQTNADAVGKIKAERAADQTSKQLSSVRSELVRLQKTQAQGLQRLTARVDACADQITGTEASVAAAHSKISSANKDTSSVDQTQTMSALETKVLALARQVDAVQNHAQSQVSAMETKVKRMGADAVDAVKADMEALKAQQVDASSQWDALKTKVNRLNALESKVKSLGELGTQLQHLRTDMDAMSTRIRDAKHKARDDKSANDDTQAVSAADFEACTSRLSRLEKIVGPDSGDGSVHETLASLRSRLTDIVTSQSQVQSKQRKLESAVAAVEKTQAESSKAPATSPDPDVVAAKSSQWLTQSALDPLQDRVTRLEDRTARLEESEGARAANTSNTSNAETSSDTAPDTDKLEGVEARLQRLEEELVESTEVNKLKEQIQLLEAGMGGFQTDIESLRTSSSSLSTKLQTELQECQQQFSDISATVVKQVARIAKVEAVAHKGAADDMQQKYDHLETAFREFVDQESEHVAELQSQLREVRERGKALQGPLAAVSEATEAQAGRVRDVEGRLEQMDARLVALQRLLEATGGSEVVGGSRGGQHNDRAANDGADNSQQHKSRPLEQKIQFLEGKISDRDSEGEMTYSPDPPPREEKISFEGKTQDPDPLDDDQSVGVLEHPALDRATFPQRKRRPPSDVSKRWTMWMEIDRAMAAEMNDMQALMLSRIEALKSQDVEQIRAVLPWTIDDVRQWSGSQTAMWLENEMGLSEAVQPWNQLQLQGEDLIKMDEDFLRNELRVEDEEKRAAFMLIMFAIRSGLNSNTRVEVSYLEDSVGSDDSFFMSSVDQSMINQHLQQQQQQQQQQQHQSAEEAVPAAVAPVSAGALEPISMSMSALDMSTRSLPVANAALGVDLSASFDQVGQVGSLSPNDFKRIKRLDSLSNSHEPGHETASRKVHKRSKRRHKHKKKVRKKNKLIEL